MSIVSEVKCGKCDRMYSGARARCPYCSARRIGSRKHSDDADNARGQMLIALLIAFVLVVATGVLIFTDEESGEIDIPQVMQSPEEPDDEDEDEDPLALAPLDPVVPLEDLDADDEDTDKTFAFEVRSLTITYDGSERTEFTAKVDETVPLRVRVEPVGVESEPIWTSSDRSVFEVVKANVGGTAVNVKGIGPGTATLTVSIGDVSQECVVRVRS